MSTKKSVGGAALELQKKQDEKINPIDLQREIHKGSASNESFEGQIRICVERGKKMYDKDFYIVVLFKKERLLKNVVRQYFFPRKTCPFPDYDQVVYKYSKNPENLEFLWVVPDKQSTIDLALMKHQLSKEQSELVRFVEDFNNGKLDQLSNRLNNSISN